ncbi:cytochrome P450 10-like [Oculina patagonica]
MAFRFVMRPSLAFRGLQRYKQPLQILPQSLIRLQQTQAVEGTAEEKSFSEMPGPKGLPVVGTLFGYVRDKGHTRMHDIQHQRVQQYGEIYHEKILDYETVTISNPDDVQYLFRHEGKYPQREPLFPLWMKYKQDRKQAEGVFSLQGEEWFKVRRILNMKMLKPKVIGEYSQQLSDVITDLLSRMKQTRDGDGVVPNIQQELFKWSLESIGTVLFETRFGSFDKSPSVEAAKFITAVEELFVLFLKVFLIPVWVDKFYRLKMIQQFYDGMDVLYDFGDKCIENRLNEIREKLENGDFNDEDAAEFLTFLISRDDISSSEITANLVEILMAAVETTSNTSLWTLYMLAKNPDVQRQLYEEVSSVLQPDELATPATLQKMPFLRGCIKETLRLFPVAWENARFLKEDIVIKGYRIPPNTMIRTPLYVMGRDPELFDDPLEYKPERWLRDDSHKPPYHPFATLPFGFGTRMCLGRRVAELEMHLLLSEVSRNFWIESLNEVKPASTGLLKPDREVKLRLVDR